MAICLLCMKESRKQIKIFSEQGLQLNCCAIISKHFWLQPKDDEQSPDCVCVPCWEIVRDFHQYYLRVAEAHNYLETKNFETLNFEATYPLPDILKSEDINNADKLTETDLFDPEIKLEVNDLDTLPQIEIIEGNTGLSSRALRATRRSRQTNENKAVRNAANKRIKRELYTESDNDSETELPLSVLLQTDTKTEENNDTLSEENKITSTPPEVTTAPPQKKRRGRPPKALTIPQTTEEAKEKTTEQPESNIETPKDVKEEQNSNNEDPDYFSAPHFSGTDDSASSSSDTNSDSDSLPEPPLRFAEIPKRVVVKPKKYRKRQKPVVPPRRMTKEELEKKRQQQEEYDKIIAKFFDKFQCPKCELLVQNFGDMRRHFSASHNDNSGYMLCCGKKFHLRKSMAEHVLIHWNPEHFKCSICGKILQESRALELHELSHSQPPGEVKEKKVFSCDNCPKTFSAKAALEHHLYSKHVPKSEFKFSCPECNKKLPTERKLKDHLKYAHDPESAVICEKCGKQMRNQSTLKKHTQLEHSDVPRPVPVPMQCEICGTWLRHLAGLKQHMKSIHEEAGEHRCHICNKTSTNARALKRHIYHNHECERKHKCTMCEKAFKRKQDLREHTSVHTGEVLYTCPNCPMTFFSNANMYKHRQRLHRAEWEADRKKPRPPNIMRQAVGATAAMKMKQAIGSSSAFFAQKMEAQTTLTQHVQTNLPQLGSNLI